MIKFHEIPNSSIIKKNVHISHEIFPQMKICIPLNKFIRSKSKIISSWYLSISRNETLGKRPAQPWTPRILCSSASKRKCAYAYIRVSTRRRWQWKRIPRRAEWKWGLAASRIARGLAKSRVHAACTAYSRACPLERERWKTSRAGPRPYSAARKLGRAGLRDYRSRSRSFLSTRTVSLGKKRPGNRALLVTRIPRKIEKDSCYASESEGSLLISLKFMEYFGCNSCENISLSIVDLYYSG